MNPLVKNRPYFLKIRNRLFRESSSHFEELPIKNFQPLHNTRDIILFDKFRDLLESCFEFSQQAIAGYSNRKWTSQQSRQQIETLADDILVVHFMEEVLSSAGFIQNRIKTMRNILHYKNLILLFPSSKNKDSKNLRQDLSNSIVKNEKNELYELNQILQMIRKRMQLIKTVLNHSFPNP